MCAPGVGAAEHRAVVGPDAGPHLPALVGAAERRHERREHEGQGQPVGEHDVDEHVDRVGAPRSRRSRRSNGRRALRCRGPSRPARRRSRAGPSRSSRRARGGSPPRRRRAVGRAPPDRATARRRSSAGRATISRQPGRSSMTRCARMRIRSGSVERDDCARRARSRGRTTSVAARTPRCGDRLPRRFQLSGRSAASDMSAMSSIRSAPISPIAAMNSSVVPGGRAPRAASASSSSCDDGARRHGVAVAVGVRLAERRRHAQRAGTHRRRGRARTIASICSGVAAPPTASSPITTRRIVEWPTRNPALTPSWPSSRSSHSPKVCQSHGGPGLQRVEGHALDRAPSCA